MIIIGTPHTKNAGYFLNDDTASGGKKSEADVRTCTHCQRVILMQAWKEDGAWCHKCFAPICGPCGDEMLTHGCVPFMQRLERFTDAVVKYQQHLKVAGLNPVAPPSIILTGL